MKVLQTIGGMAATGGGTSSCTYQLFKAFERLNTGIKLLTVRDSNPDSEDLGKGSDWLISLPYDCKTPVSYSKGIAEYLNAYDYNIYHTNGLWMYLNHVTCSTARKHGKPYIITPHGMLYEETLRRSRWKKLLIQALWFRKDILQSNCIHVTCAEEMRQVRRYGYTGPIAIISNPVEIPEYIDEIIEDLTPADTGKHVIGYLGRLHPRKQVERILHGLAILPKEEKARVKVAIMGAGDTAYIQFLNDEISRLGLETQVEFIGFVNGRQKYEQLSQLSALFVPSDMENFGMIVPEALLVNTPVMASLGTPWQSLNENRCGWWVDASPEVIADVIEDVLAKSPSELKEMGSRGNEYVRRNFASDVIADKMLQLYQWILNPATTPKPEFVYL